MASMNRNLNLEEINSDAFMGIPFLKYQSILQKALFVGSMVASVVILLVGVFAFDINVNILVVICLIPLGIGVAFGCNYNQDLSLIKYLRLVLFKPSTKFVTKPTEDIEQIQHSAARIRQEEEARLAKERQSSPEEQKKLLIRLVIGVSVVGSLIVLILILSSALKKEEVHHTVESVTMEIEFDQETLEQ